MIANIVISLIASISTFHLSKFKSFGAVRSSAFLSLIAYVILYFISPHYELYAIVFFGGSFVGMSCPSKMNNVTIVIGGVLFALFFQYLVPFLKGYGGALGLSAFLSVAIIQLILHLRRKLASSS